MGKESKRSRPTTETGSGSGDPQLPMPPREEAKSEIQLHVEELTKRLENLSTKKVTEFQLLNEQVRTFREKCPGAPLNEILPLVGYFGIDSEKSVMMDAYANSSKKTIKDLPERSPIFATFSIVYKLLLLSILPSDNIDAEKLNKIVHGVYNKIYKPLVDKKKLSPEIEKVYRDARSSSELVAFVSTPKK